MNTWNHIYKQKCPGLDTKLHLGTRLQFCSSKECRCPSSLITLRSTLIWSGSTCYSLIYGLIIFFKLLMFHIDDDIDTDDDDYDDIDSDDDVVY